MQTCANLSNIRLDLWVKKIWLLMCSFQTNLSEWYLQHLMWHYSYMNAPGLIWQVNIGSGNVIRQHAITRFSTASDTLMPYGILTPQWVKDEGMVTSLFPARIWLV